MNELLKEFSNFKIWILLKHLLKLKFVFIKIPIIKSKIKFWSKDKVYDNTKLQTSANSGIQWVFLNVFASLNQFPFDHLRIEDTLPLQIYHSNQQSRNFLATKQCTAKNLS